MFKIFTPPHTLHAALILCDKLNGMGRPAKIVDKIDRRDPDTYIIYNAAAHNFINLPKKYVVIQTEIAGTHWFNPNYHKILSHAIAVWDYCAYNQQAYSHPKMSLVTPGFTEPGVYEKDIDYLFYGWINGSDRRSRILTDLQKELNINIVTDKVGREIWPILKRTKVVINIHYYDFSPVEMYRQNESLSFGCQFHSEPKNISEFAEQLTDDLIDFNSNRPHSDLMFLDNTREIELALNKAGL
jgi:hypothetical protein